MPEEKFRHFCWREGDLSFKLDELQLKIRNNIALSHAEKLLVLSSRQIGKSFLAVIIGLELCIKYPGSLVRIMAPTLKQVADIVQDNMGPICADAPDGLISRSKSDYRWQIAKSQMRLGPLDRANVDNNRGGNADFFILEEGGFVTSDDYKYAVESVVGPQLLRSSGRELHISSPSEDAEHYLHTVVMPYCESVDSLYHYSVFDSPSITPAMIEKAIIKCGGVETDSFRREYLAEIVRSKTLTIVPEFDEARHVREFELPEYYRSCLTIDMGGVRDKTAGYSCIWDFARAKLLIYDELFLPSNSPSSQVVDICRDMSSRFKLARNDVYADVPGQVQVDLQIHFGFTVVVPLKDDRDAAVNNFRLLFQLDKIEIHPRCKALIGTLKTGRYNNQRTDFLRTEQYGHADAIMAAVYGARMIDRITNPFPKPEFHPDTQLRLAYRSEADSKLQQVAEALIPWRPGKKT